jgi:hypothetical protein
MKLHKGTCGSFIFLRLKSFKKIQENKYSLTKNQNQVVFVQSIIQFREGLKLRKKHPIKRPGLVKLSPLEVCALDFLHRFE